MSVTSDNKKSDKKLDDQDNNKLLNQLKKNIPFLFIVMLAFSLITYKQFSKTKYDEINYSQFKQIISEQADSIKEAEFEENGTQIKLTLNNDKVKLVRLPKNFTSNNIILEELAENKINSKVTASAGNRIFFFIANVLPIILISVFILLMLRGASGGGLGFLKSKAKLFKEDNIKTTFNDVAGIDEAKAELEEVVDFLKNPDKFKEIGAKIPKGVLLVGPPGTGKTLLAKAIAGEAKVPFYSISGSDFIEMFAGLGASRVRDLFEQARKSSPCIIFIDEIDAIGRQRGAAGGMGGHDEREQTLNQMLVEMDGFEDSDSNVIVLAATNRPDILDKALVRPGRFDRRVSIDAPDAKGREKILKVHSKGKKFAEGVTLEVIAKRTPGFTGAQLANVMNESALIAATKDKKAIDKIDIDEAIDKVWMGMKRSLSMPFEEIRMTAYHETGHALMALLDEKMPLHKVTIVPRSMALGITWSLSKDDYSHMTKSSLISRIKVAFGGMVAEELVFNDTTAGVTADLESATGIARKMVKQFGMSDLGPISFGRDTDDPYAMMGSNNNYSEEMSKNIDFTVQTILKDLYQEVKDYIDSKRKEMDAIVFELLQKETLDSKEVKDIIEQVENNTYNFEQAQEEVDKIKEKITKSTTERTELEQPEEVREENNNIEEV